MSEPRITTPQAASRGQGLDGVNPATPLRVALYLLTLLSAGAALFVEPALAGAVARRAISRKWLFLPLAVYSVFLLAYALDRWHLVRSRGYPNGKAFFQVAFGVLFASVLLPSTIQDYKEHRPAKALRLLTHVDPDVREAAVYSLGYQGQSGERRKLLVERLDDRNPAVRGAAVRVLSAWAGVDPSDEAALRRWVGTGSSTASIGGGAP